jgi:hypothetical protein
MSESGKRKLLTARTLNIQRLSSDRKPRFLQQVAVSAETISVFLVWVVGGLAAGREKEEVPAKDWGTRNRRGKNVKHPTLNFKR